MSKHHHQRRAEVSFGLAGITLTALVAALMFSMSAGGSAPRSLPYAGELVVWGLLALCASFGTAGLWHTFRAGRAR